VREGVAPSTIVWMPRSRASRAMSRTGTAAREVVMWQMWITFVFA